MLLRLHIEDLAIIDRLTLDFDAGFTALTGETGAGKSIIIGALNLVLGERASSEDVRSGCETGIAEALFDVSSRDDVTDLLRTWEFDGAGTGELIIRREVSAQGRSKCLVNGRMLTVAQLKELGDLLVDLHGQHQHQSLLHAERHREILDLFGGEKVQKMLGEARALHAQHADIARRLRSLNRDERDIERQRDILEYQLNEIHEARLEPGEDSALDGERRRLEHAETLQQNAMGAVDALYEGESAEVTVSDLLAQCVDLLSGAARLDPSLEKLSGRLNNTHAEIDDIATELRAYADDLEHDPARLAEVDDRLDLIRKLRRKYGEDITAILNEADRIETELNTLVHGREEQERLEKERVATEKKLAEACETLSAERAKVGQAFAKGLRAELKELEMPDVRFEVALGREEPADDEAGVGFPDGRRYQVHPWGVDVVEFLISPNKGEDLRALRRIASGGELSRIMLSLKVLLRSHDQVPTLVFDEIDTGISGRTGTRIGSKMTELGKRFQVLCITHLPQIAARAGCHFAVAKGREKGRTLTRVTPLDAEGRAAEIARLLGGDTGSTAALEHARELLNAARS